MGNEASFFHNANVSAMQRAIGKFNTAQERAEVYNTQLNELCDALAAVQFKADLRPIVNEMIELEKQVNALFNDFNALDKEIVQSVRRQIASMPEFANIAHLLNYAQISSEHIRTATERLTTKELFMKVPTAQAEIEVFLADIDSLKVYEELIEKEREVFRELLNNASTLEEVLNTERDIELYDASFNQILKSLITYPKEQETLVALSSFMESNPHKFAPLYAFDIVEDLADDVFHAKGRMDSVSSLRQSPGG